MIDEILVNIKTNEGTEQICLKQISDNLFRFNETSIINPDLQLGTIAELLKTENGDYEIIKIVEKSKFIMHDWILSKQFIDSKEFDELKNLILNLDGTWEQIMNGIFIAHLPEKNNNTFTNKLKRLKLNNNKTSKWETFLTYLRNRIRLKKH